MKIKKQWKACIFIRKNTILFSSLNFSSIFYSNWKQLYYKSNWIKAKRINEAKWINNWLFNKQLLLVFFRFLWIIHAIRVGFSSFDFISLLMCILHTLKEKNKSISTLHRLLAFIGLKRFVYFRPLYEWVKCTIDWHYEINCPHLILVFRIIIFSIIYLINRIDIAIRICQVLNGWAWCCHRNSPFVRANNVLVAWLCLQVIFCFLGLPPKVKEYIFVWRNILFAQMELRNQTKNTTTKSYEFACQIIMSSYCLSNSRFIFIVSLVHTIERIF